MKISIQGMKYVNQQYGCSDNSELGIPTNELVRKIGAQLGEVEEIIDLGAKYQGIYAAQVVSCEKHPNADKLHVCKIDDARAAQNVDRDENGYVQVVCGAPNVRQGLAVAWLPPGSTVPASVDKDPFVLEARELRGVVSNGMLASASELAISDDHGGLLELADDVQPGTLIAGVLGLNDTIIDIENKMFTHRPDCFGQLGVAREIAGIQGKAFKSPDWYLNPQKLQSQHSEAIKEYGVTVETPDLCPRYMLLAMDNVKIGQSPAWLQSYLSRIGIRPINNIVDMTNYMMVLTGQPLHAFDFDKVARDGNAQIIVRKPREGEKMTLLDGKEIQPRADAILICDQDKPIALGGVMGGSNSEIDENTTRILIECANFDMYNIRKTSMEHGIFTDAVTRFNKGQSPWQCPAVLYKAAEMVKELCPEAIITGEPIDNNNATKQNQPVEITAAFINERLGLSLVAEEMKTLLRNVEFEVEANNENLKVTAPFWRTDIEIREDVVEEVGRLYGYDHLPLELPKRDITPAVQNPMLELKKQTREVLSSAGANEVLTYSFVHGNLLEKAGQDKDLAFQLSNALSPDLQYYRLSLTPSLLDKVHANIKAGYGEFALFEMNKVHVKVGNEFKDEDGLPYEAERIGFVFAADQKHAEHYNGAAFYQAKKYVENLFSGLAIDDYSIRPYVVPNSENDAVGMAMWRAPFEVGRSAYVYATIQGHENTVIGVVGEYKNSVRRSLKLPDFCAGFELDISLLKLLQANSTYKVLSKFPKTQQDISFRVRLDVTYQQLHDLVTSELLNARAEHGYDTTLRPVDIYQAQDSVDVKHITLRVWLSHSERTLVTEEVNTLLDKIAQKAADELRAERV